MSATISDDKLKEILDMYKWKGEEETLSTYGIKQDTLRRYLDEAESRGIGSSSLSKTLQDIISIYSENELKAIAKGGRITPGYEKIPIISFEGKRIRIGHITDTHIGSAYFNDERLYQAFEEFKKEKVDFITHSGDVTEGMSHRPGHIYELSDLGYDRQKDKAIELFGQWTDTDIYAIDGNHDRWYIKSNGAIIVKDIASALTNFHFLGHDECDISLNGKAVLKLWHGEDGSCFDDETEILTKEMGFIKFKYLDKDMHVATMTKDDHKFQWQQPTDITAEQYSGDMYNIKDRTLDLNVTPNHGMWVEHTKSILNRKNELDYPIKSHQKLQDGWFRIDVKDMVGGFRKQKYTIPKTVNSYDFKDVPQFTEIPRIESKNKGMDKKMNHVGTIFTLDLARLIAWYVTEGHATENSVNISQYKDKNLSNYNDILELVSTLGVNYTISDVGVSIHGKELSEYLRKECGHLSANKYLPEWIMDGNEVILRVVFNAMIKGDGWARKDSYGYRSISKKLREQLGLIAMKLGYAVNYNKDQVYINTVQINPSIVKKPSKFKYDGMIYCCEVPNGLIYVRRHGKTAWTHNSYALSYRIQKILESLSGGEKPNILVAGHTHKYVKIFERNVYAFSAGSIQRQTPWMRGKRIAAHVGFVIADYWVNDKGISKMRETWYPFYV